jgi:hypothetical protein
LIDIFGCLGQPIAVETSVGVLRPVLIAASQLSGLQRFHTDVAAIAIVNRLLQRRVEQIEMRNLRDADLNKSYTASDTNNMILSMADPNLNASLGGRA